MDDSNDLYLPNDKWLFVCAANYVRSPTAEYVARRRKLLADSCAAPARDEDFHVQRLTPLLIAWADVIVCMEREHVERVMVYPTGHRQVYCWDLPDNWQEPYDPALIGECERRLAATLYARKTGRDLAAVTAQPGEGWRAV